MDGVFPRVLNINPSSVACCMHVPVKIFKLKKKQVKNCILSITFFYTVTKKGQFAHSSNFLIVKAGWGGGVFQPLNFVATKT